MGRDGLIYVKEDKKMGLRSNREFNVSSGIPLAATLTFWTADLSRIVPGLKILTSSLPMLAIVALTSELPTTSSLTSSLDGVVKGDGAAAAAAKIAVRAVSSFMVSLK